MYTFALAIFGTTLKEFLCRGLVPSRFPDLKRSPFDLEQVSKPLSRKDIPKTSIESISKKLILGVNVLSSIKRRVSCFAVYIATRCPTLVFDGSRFWMK